MALHVTVTLDCSAADLPQYLQLVLGHSPLQAGLWALPVAIGAITGSLLAATLARAVRPGWLIGGGLLIAAGGYLTLSALDLDGTAWIAFTGGTLIGAGIGIADTVSNDVIVGTAPPEKAGAAAGISETAYELGGPSAPPSSEHWAPASTAPTSTGRCRTPCQPRSATPSQELSEPQSQPPSAYPLISPRPSWASSAPHSPEP